MDQPPTSFARYAGLVRFPRGEADLTSTSHCPACFTVLTDVVCTNCGLDLDNPAAARLALLSTDAAGLLNERTELIGRIRFETAAHTRQAEVLAAAQSAADPTTVQAPPATVQVAVDVHIPAAPVAPPVSLPPVSPTGGRATPAQSGPRRSSVQVGLIVVGVSLVSVAAIFFLVYAFINYGIVWRSVIIGAITVAAFLVASLLRRRGLGSTAEGIGAFSVVLVYLDAFAIRANDLFDAASADPLVYWGTTLVVSAAGFAVWHRVSTLRVGAVGSAIAFAPGVALLVAGLAGSLESGTRVFVSLLAVGIAALLHPFAGARGAARPALHSPERAIALTIGGLGMVAAFFAAFLVAPSTDAGPTVALLALAVTAAAHLVVIVRSADNRSDADPTLPRTVVAFFAALVAVCTTVGVATLAYRGLPFGGAMLGSTVVPTLLALVAGYYALRSAPNAVGLALRVGAVAGAGVAAVAALVPVGVVVTLDVVAVGDALAPGAWSRAPADPVATGVPDSAAAAAAVALVLASVALFGRLTARSDLVRGAVVGCGAALLVLAVPLLTTLAATITGWFVLAAASLALLVWSARSGALAPHRRAIAGVAVTTTLLAYSLSWASLDTWLAGTVATVALLLAARLVWAAPAVGVRSALLSLAVVVALVGAAAGGRQFGALFGDARQGADERAVWANVLAVALFALSAVPLSRVLSGFDRRALFLLGGSVAVGTAPLAGGNVALSVVFAAALVGWMLAARTGSNGVERAVAAFALAPALVGLVIAVRTTLDVTDEFTQVGLVAAALLTAAMSLAFAVLRRGYHLRTASDLGIAVVTPVCVGAFVLAPSGLAWLGLLLGAVTLLLSAVSPAGLFGAGGRRKHLGWAALALATAALWLRLSEASVTAVEPYVLPLAAALAAIAALDWRARRGAATPALALAAMIVGIVPIALAAATDDSARAVTVGAVASAMLLAGSVLRAPAWARPYLDGLVVAGFVSVVIVTVGQVARLAAATRDGTDGRADLWLAAALVVLVVSAFGQCSGRPGDTGLTPVVGQALAVSGLVVVGVVESVLLDAAPIGFTRAVAVVALFSAVHALGRTVHTAPLTRATGWVALALGGLIAVVAVAVGSVDAVEWVSLPIAVALLVSGTARLRAEPTLRSWPALGAGLLVLLLPSLVESQSDSPVWRLVAIGAVSVAVLVVGVVLRLQAPFVVGGAVALVHGFATFAPQLLDVYRATEWWVWIGIGGAVIIVLGARYERSIATAKNVVAGIGGLR